MWEGEVKNGSRKKKGDGKEGRKGEEAMKERKEVKPPLGQPEPFPSSPNAY